MIDGEMRDEPPLRATTKRRPHRLCRLSKTPDWRQGTCTFHFKIALAATKREFGGKVPIAACGMNGNRLYGGHPGVESKVHQRNVKFRARVVFSLSRTPGGIPESLVPFSLNRVFYRIKRLVF